MRYFSLGVKGSFRSSRPSLHPPVRGENVKTFRWDQRNAAPVPQQAPPSPPFSPENSQVGQVFVFVLVLVSVTRCRTGNLTRLNHTLTVCVTINTGAPIATCFLFFPFLFIGERHSLPLSLCMERTSYVLSFRMLFFYLVTTGWIFDISLCENSINQTINQSIK